jgi:hypothetical protein
MHCATAHRTAKEDVDLPVDDEAGTAGENASQTLEQARAYQRRRMDDPPPMPRVLQIADWKCNRADGTDSWLEVVTHCPKARPSKIGACEVRWPSMHARAQAVGGLANGTMCSCRRLVQGVCKICREGYAMVEVLDEGFWIWLQLPKLRCTTHGFRFLYYSHTQVSIDYVPERKGTRNTARHTNAARW